MRSADVYLAFADGALTYDCPSCGKCCRGLGLGGDLVRIGQLPHVRRIGAFLDHDNTQGPLASFFTYADGCRYQGDDNLCDIHRTQGAAQKPRICRLFPFSKLVDLDGLWCLLPHHRCPWTAAGDEGPAELSRHAAVLADIRNADDTFLAAVNPTRKSAVTPLEVDRRRALEVAIRDGLGRPANADLDGRAARALKRMRAQHQAHGAGALPAPVDRELWLDLLRCAGEPPPLSVASERLFIAAIPAMRVDLCAALPLEAVPNALEAFALYLRVLAELGRRDLRGEDLLGLLAHAVPLVRVLASATLPLPALPVESPTALLDELWPELREKCGEPLGETLLMLLRPFERGALPRLHAIGACLAFAAAG